VSFDDAYARGVARAKAAMAEAETPLPIDADWCRFGPGLDCLNGDDCRNPRHRRAGTVNGAGGSSGPGTEGRP
jgi:hypothetical protein